MNEQQQSTFEEQILQQLDKGLGELPLIDSPDQVDEKLIQNYIDGELDDNAAARRSFFKKISSDRSWNDAFIRLKFPKAWEAIRARRQFRNHDAQQSTSQEKTADDDSAGEFSMQLKTTT